MRSTGLIVLLSAALLLSHPYTGIRHDGILYFGDALNRLVPGVLADDLYFKYGSQGRFTVLPTLYAEAIGAFGIGSGTIVALLTALALQVAATFYVATWLATTKLRGYVALSVLLGWSIYGGLRVFAYGEQFLTARSFAEPLVLFGLGTLWRGRKVVGLVVLAAALFVHPLMALGGFFVAWVWLCFQDRRWLVALPVSALACLLLGWWGGPPFDDLSGRYDKAWFALIDEANPQAFVAHWTLADFNTLFYALVVLALASSRVENARVAAVARAAAIAGIAGVALSYVVVDWFNNPFFAKLQIWRVLWLAQWLAMAVLPLLVVALWKRGEAGRIAAVFLVIGWMAGFSIAPAIVALLALVMDRFGSRITVTPATTRIVVGVLIVTVVAIIGQHWARSITFGASAAQPLSAIAGQMIATGVLVAVLSGSAVWLIDRSPAGGVVAVAVLAIAAIGFWDQRSSWTRTLEEYPVGSQIWPDYVKPGTRVYWYRDLIAPWILLRHANYYTQQQSSGAVFSRDMIFELDRRSKLTALLDLQEQICRMMNGLNNKQNSCEPDADAVRTVCREGGIDFVVLQSGLEGVVPTAHFSTGVFESGYEKKFFLYSCTSLN